MRPSRPRQAAIASGISLKDRIEILDSEAIRILFSSLIFHSLEYQANNLLPRPSQRKDNRLQKRQELQEGQKSFRLSCYFCSFCSHLGWKFSGKFGKGASILDRHARNARRTLKSHFQEPA